MMLFKNTFKIFHKINNLITILLLLCWVITGKPLPIQANKIINVKETSNKVTRVNVQTHLR